MFRAVPVPLAVWNAGATRFPRLRSGPRREVLGYLPPLARRTWSLPGRTDLWTRDAENELGDSAAHDGVVSVGGGSLSFFDFFCASPASSARKLLMPANSRITE